MNPDQPPSPTLHAPTFRLVAVHSGRVVQHPGLEARALVLLFHNHQTLDAVRPLQEAVRGRYPDAGEVLVASVADLGFVPRPMRRLAEKFMRRAYAEATRYVPAGLDPADYVVILPDWTGRVTEAFGVAGTGERAALVVIDREGQVLGRQQGGALGEAALRSLAAAGVLP